MKTVKGRILRKREKSREEVKQKLIESTLEREESKLDRRITKMSHNLDQDGAIPKHLLPGRNDPCICGTSKKKYKYCCMRDIESGKIKIVAKEDPNLEPEEKK